MPQHYEAADQRDSAPDLSTAVSAFTAEDYEIFELTVFSVKSRQYLRVFSSRLPNGEPSGWSGHKVSVRKKDSPTQILRSGGVVAYVYC